ncbi:alpha/beta fold hydrolase [Salinicoccus sp. ID82-1]|uniref:alpha/beta fold hydrolase n=1 Tax=Salinicoccus sp. ID82-1 TaxID=2820269 RepID=UPI001F3B6D4E|nr:alpha/beta fold hydrolase [Salinicoccus sp. ID82-1]MCG1010707.1 alpha/beta fold hydrolase [Salinicoccus sp. ID82-1]
MILHTEVSGGGEPIVFLHTGLQTGSTELDIQRKYFKDDYQVILPDLRGHGKSVSNDVNNYFNNSAEDLAETLESLDVESTHIVGCSLGALVGLIFAKKFPEKVKTLTLSGIIPEKPSDWVEMNKKDIEHTEKLLKDPETVVYFDSIHKGNWRELLQTTQESDWYPFNETADLSMLDLPVLYIVGEHNAHETAGVLIYPKMNKNVHASIIPFAGHVVHLEQPEIYNKILENFLNYDC